MPVIDGPKLLDKIKSVQHLKHIPVVMLSASQREQQYAMSSSIEAAGVYPRPASYKALVDLMEEILGKVL